MNGVSFATLSLCVRQTDALGFLVLGIYLKSCGYAVLGASPVPLLLENSAREGSLVEDNLEQETSKP